MSLLRGAFPLVLLLCVGCCRTHYEAGVSAVPTFPRGRKESRALQSSSAGAQASVQAKPSSGVSLDLVQTPLSAAIGVLGSGSAANIVVSPRVYEERTPEELLVTVRLNDVTVETALTWITRLLRLRWYRQNGVLYVTVPDDAPDNVPTRVYSVHDLLANP
ncbi:MAG: hypothetical protein V2A58_16825 [Planctomycetota bacterium]